MKKIIIDIDMTLTKGKGPGGYEDALVNKDLVVKLKEYKEQGFMIVL
ncbi:capsular biosynthesis protein, partial [Salmonella enterica subsp. diarizonae]|nr:capsular biosynthesis protein [Salmonella enterica]EEF7199688.1 capsular biosynthesis protein [Salmonella enterica]EGT9064880.1 capsular biosynthesis protein [Salmonella enterica]EJD3998960.1 capsular biosynthesis protein [Salmonella enterica subsp. diarizonae]